MITTEQIKKLRDETGVSVMQCRKALEEAGGDEEKAKIILRKISKQTAEKKSDRNFGSGAIMSYVHSNGLVGSMVELLCETDFVARNEDFRALAKDIAMHVTALAPEYLKAEDVPAEAKIKARELFVEELMKDGKERSGEMRDKIIEGKLAAFLSEKVLLDQPFIKNPDVTIRSLVEAANQKFGERTEIGRFVRFALN